MVAWNAEVAFGSVFTNRETGEVVMALAPDERRWPDWFRVVVLVGAPGVDYSAEVPVPLRIIGDGERWEAV